MPMTPPAVAVLSVKGGAGKTAATLNVALELSFNGFRVGLLDGDVDSPYLGELVGASGANMRLQADRRLRPVPWKGPRGEDVRVVSWSLYMGKSGVATVMQGEGHRQFLRDAILRTDWGAIDVLVVDEPAGSSSAHLAVREALGERLRGVIAVVQPIGRNIMERVWDLCANEGAPILGVVSNMDGSLAPSGRPAVDPMTGLEFYPFGQACDVAAWCEERRIPYLGRLPMSPLVIAGQAAGNPLFPEAMLPAIRNAASAVRRACDLRGAGK